MPSESLSLDRAQRKLARLMQAAAERPPGEAPEGPAYQVIYSSRPTLLRRRLGLPRPVAIAAAPAPKQRPRERRARRAQASARAPDDPSEPDRVVRPQLSRAERDYLRAEVDRRRRKRLKRETAIERRR